MKIAVSGAGRHSAEPPFRSCCSAMVWGDQTYSKLFYWNEVPKGGHFAALEQPELFIAELRKSFVQWR